MANIILLCVTFVAAVINFLAIHVLFGWLWLLIYIIRWIAIVTAKYRQDFGKILSWVDITMWDDYSKRHRGTSSIVSVFEGDISSKEFKRLFIKNVLNATFPKTNKPKFPELKQYQSYWLGFLFWRDDKHFNVENHIREVYADKNPSQWGTTEAIWQRLSLNPYARKTSPWEVYIVRNFESHLGSKKTLIFWRIHHSMADGFALISLLVNSFGQSQNTITKPNVLQQQSFSLLNGWGILILFPLAVFKMQMQILQNFWFKRTKVDRKGTGKVHSLYSKEIPLAQVKLVAKTYNVRVSAVAMSLIAENLAKILKPKTPYFYATYSMPVPNHPGTLTNHAQIGTIPLPVGVDDTLLNRMQKVNKSFLSLRSDLVPTVIKYFGFLSASMFPPLARFIMKIGSYTPVAFSNISVGTEFQLEGRDCTTFTGYITPFEDVSDSIMVAQGFKDHMMFAVGVDDNFLSKDEVHEFIDGVVSDFEKLVKDSGILKHSLQE